MYWFYNDVFIIIIFIFFMSVPDNSTERSVTLFSGRKFHRVGTSKRPFLVFLNSFLKRRE